MINYIATNPELMLFVQLALATLFGMILGIERVMAGRTAGPRTYGLVALGSCLLTIISITSLSKYPDLTNGDPYHVISSIVTGVGFIGAGLIIFREKHLSGLTTAAGIWVAAAIGISVGFKFYLLAFFTTFLTLFIFTVMWHIEHKIKSVFKNDIAAGHED